MITQSTLGMWLFIRREMARYWNVWGQTIVPPVLSAVLFLFVFGHALGDRIGDFAGVPYLTFLVPGLIIQGAISNAYANTSTSVFDGRRAGYIEDVLTSPLTTLQVVLAYALSGASRGIIIGGLTLLIGLPVGGGFNVAWLPFLVVLTLACTLFALIGMIAGLYASRWDHIFVPNTFLLTPLTFLGGVFYPVSNLSPGLQTASRFNPIYYIVDAQRATTLGSADLPWGPSALVLTLWVVFLAGVVWRLFDTSPRLRG